MADMQFKEDEINCSNYDDIEEFNCVMHNKGFKKIWDLKKEVSKLK